MPICVSRRNSDMINKCDALTMPYREPCGRTAVYERFIDGRVLYLCHAHSGIWVSAARKRVGGYAR